MNAPTQISAGDTAWVLTSTALVLLMIPGLALFYGGLVRTRAVLNTFMMSVAAVAIVGVQWVIGGYALSFGPGNVIGNLSWVGLHGVGAAAGPYSATIPHLAFTGFQAMFAGITVALISGAMVERSPHNVVYTLTGAALLWVGWLGFNAGSALAADGVAAIALVNSHAAAAAAMLAWLTIEHVRGGPTTAVGGATGAVVGLVAITPAAGYVTPLDALAIGVLGACASYAAMQWRSRAPIDDALDVFACHGVAGIVGALLTGVFATTSVNAAGANGLLYGNPRLFVVQLLAVVSTIAFTAPVTALVLARLRVIGSLRVPLPDELTGIDVSEHGEHAYDDGELSVAVGGAVRISAPVFMPTARRSQNSEAA